MRLEQVVIGVILFTVMIGIGINFIVELDTNYSLDEDTAALDRIRNQSDIIKGTQKDLRGDTLGKDVSAEGDDGELYKSGLPAAISIFESSAIAGETIEQAAKETKLIDPLLLQGFKVILSVLIAAFVIYLVLRFKPLKD